MYAAGKKPGRVQHTLVGEYPEGRRPQNVSPNINCWVLRNTQHLPVQAQHTGRKDGKDRKSGPGQRRFAEGGRVCLPGNKTSYRPSAASEDSDSLCEADKALATSSLSTGKDTPSGLVSCKQIQLWAVNQKYSYNQNGVILVLGIEDQQRFQGSLSYMVSSRLARSKQ